jgi:nonsense-mediated mRNA decay protein 3
MVISKKMHEQFGGELKISSTLHTRDTKKNKNLYRMTVMLRLPDFSKGDIIALDNTPCKVKSISKNIATCLDLVKRKIKKVNFMKSKVKALETHEVMVSKRYPSLEVLDPETYQSVEVENPRNIRKEKIKIVMIDKKIFIAD